MNRNNMEHLAKEGNILARNQKVPSAQEPCVSSLAISHHPPQLCDLDMAAAQTPTRMTAGDRNSGWREMQSQLGEHFDVNQGILRLQQPCPLWQGLLCPVGVTSCRNQLLRKICLFCGGVRLEILPQIYLMGHLWKGETKFWMCAVKPVACRMHAVFAMML